MKWKSPNEEVPSLPNNGKCSEVVLVDYGKNKNPRYALAVFWKSVLEGQNQKWFLAPYVDKQPLRDLPIPYRWCYIE